MMLGILSWIGLIFFIKSTLIKKLYNNEIIFSLYPSIYFIINYMNLTNNKNLITFLVVV